MKVAIIGAGHWHVEIFYLPYLAEMEDVEVVALADPSEGTLERRKPMAPGARTYLDYREMLEAERPEFVFAHAPHCDMTEVAAYLVEAGMPFHMEKPMGLNARALAKVAEVAKAKGLFVSVPFVSRYFGVAASFVELARAGELGEAFHYYYRLFAGRPDRYRAWGVDWMLDPEKAGPGPLFNFGPHAIDLMLAVTGWRPRRVFAAASHRLHGGAIPDLASVMVEAGDGQIGVCEVGYTLDGGYERYFSLSTERLHYGGPPDVGAVRFRDGREVVVDGPPESESYRLYTRDVVRRFAAGEPPMAGIEEMVETLRVMCAAREAIETGEVVEVEGEE